MDEQITAGGHGEVDPRGGGCAQLLCPQESEGYERRLHVTTTLRPDPHVTREEGAPEVGPEQVRDVWE
jgi:hypothetical protein